MSWRLICLVWVGPGHVLEAYLLNIPLDIGFYEDLTKTIFHYQGAQIAQLGEHRTLDHKVMGSNPGRGVSLSKTLHPHCLVLVKPRKPFQND